MRLIDISVTIREDLPTFPGDPAILIERDGGPGSLFHLTRLQLGSHAGTHIDAPAHLLKDGSGVDAIPLDTLVGLCRVIDLRGHNRPVSAAELESFDLRGVRRLLLRTDNSELWKQAGFAENYTGLTPAAATLLVDCGVRLIGIDYLSIESFDGTGETHRILLEAGLVILEGLDLSAVEPGEFELFCLPLKLAGIDGAPCRAVLRQGLK